MDSADELVVRLAVIQCLGKRLARLYVRPDKKLYRRVNLSYHFMIGAVGYYITQQAGSLACVPCQPLVTAVFVLIDFPLGRARDNKMDKPTCSR